MSLEGKVAVVTGASRGIGQEIALQLAQAGASVACIATQEARAAGTAQLITQKGGCAKAYGCDVSQSGQIEAVFQTITEELGAPLILVNNAGVTRDQLLMRMNEEEWDTVLQVNLKGAFLCAKAAVRGMMKARWGRIINISSVVGLHGAPGQANYAASKAGLIGFTQSLAKELGSRNITCNAIAPGFIETDMTADLSSDMRQWVEKQAPIARLGTAADIAPAVVFLAGEGATYITGQTLTIDGGLTL